MPYDPAASLPKVAKRNLGWLLDSLANTHISDAERATLIHLAAGQDASTIRNLAAVPPGPELPDPESRPWKPRPSCRRSPCRVPSDRSWPPTA